MGWLIKVGDKIHHEGKEWEVHFAGKTFVHLKHGDYFILESSHIFWNKLYVEQKLRADQLEKRWSELKDKTIETYVGLRKMKSILAQHIGSILCVMDELEGKDNVFETVQRLEEDGE